LGDDRVDVTGDADVRVDAQKLAPGMGDHLPQLLPLPVVEIADGDLRPSWANRIAIARPIPDARSMTIATLFASRLTRTSDITAALDETIWLPRE
jgi:hypothetical protein